MTNRFRKTIILFLVLLFISGVVGFVFAQEEVGDEIGVRVTFDELGLKEPKILPGDPLYFLKRWQRGIRKTFSFGDLRQSVFRSDLMNGLAAEVKALKEKGEGEEVLRTALQNYEENAMRLREKIASLENSIGNEKVEELLDTLIERLVRHERVFSDIGSSSGIGDDLKAAREELESATAEAVTRLDSPEGFKARLENMVSSFKEDHLKELNFVYVLNYIEEKVPEEIQGKIRELETDLTSRFEGRFKAEPGEVVPVLSLLPAQDARDLSVFDEIRERVADSGLKSEFNAIRQGIVQESGGEIVEEETLIEIIHEAEEAAEELKKRISSDDYVSSGAVEELLERAEFHLARANDLLEDGNKGVAFGQATAASATAESGLSQVRPKEEIEEENFSLRVKFDDLVGVARAKDLNRSLDPEIYDRFDEIEKLIIGADTATDLNKVKVMLAEMEVIILNKK